MEKANSHKMGNSLSISRTKIPHLATFVVLLYGNQENYNDTKRFYILRLDRRLM